MKYLSPEPLVPYSDHTSSMFSIDWETEKEYPLWCLTEDGILNVNVTNEFGAKYRLTAYTHLYDEQHKNIRNKLTKFSSDVFMKNIYGHTDEIFEHISGVGPGWYLTNNSCVAPGMSKTRRYSSEPVGRVLGLAPNPYDGFQIQFSSVPYNVFKRYWRRPISLTSKWRTRGKSKGKGLAPWSLPSMNVLLFQHYHFKKEKLILADFRLMDRHRKPSKLNDEILNWMVRYTPALKILTDEESPFTKPEHELMFSMEWL